MYLARRIDIGRRPFGSYWCLAVPNQIFGPGTEAAGEALCLKDCITQSNPVQVRKLEDYSSASVCKDGWGNHGGVGHSSKRIWLAALSRGIKTGWADKPLLLSNFHDQAFIIMHGKHILHSVMLPPGSRCVDTVEGSGHRVRVQVPCAGTSSQNMFCTIVHIDSFDPVQSSQKPLS